MWINGRFVPLQAPEGDAGGGGGPVPPPPPAEAAAAAPAPDYQALIAQQTQQIQAYQQQQQELMQQLRQQVPAQQVQHAPDEEEYLDPVVKKQLDAIKRANAEQGLLLQDQLDQRAFIEEVRAQGFSQTDAQEAAQLHQRWLQAGMRIGNQPPSRIDALVYLTGQKTVKTHASTRSAAAAAEAARIAQNQDATLGVGARSARSPGTPDLNAMDRKTRLSTGYAAVLDTEGF